MLGITNYYCILQLYSIIRVMVCFVFQENVEGGLNDFLPLCDGEEEGESCKIVLENKNKNDTCVRRLEHNPRENKVADLKLPHTYIYIYTENNRYLFSLIKLVRNGHPCFASAYQNRMDGRSRAIHEGFCQQRSMEGSETCCFVFGSALRGCRKKHIHKTNRAHTPMLLWMYHGRGGGGNA